MRVLAPEGCLVLWSFFPIIWSAMAYRLVQRQISQPSSIPSPAEISRPLLTIFKPLPPLREQAPDPQLIDALQSFVEQMDDSTEMVLGIEEQSFPFIEPWLKKWTAEFPRAHFHFVTAPKPDHFSNPKIAWLSALASHAQGEWWLWSDADIRIPTNFLSDLRSEFASSNEGAVTVPYLIRGNNRGPASLDALFVNIEFFPGALLLRSQGPASFAFGAATLFRKSDFEKKCRWEDLGNRLADDYCLGQVLQPVRISARNIETFSGEKTWQGALLHYWRWHKTVRWCRPGGYISQLLVLPALGWLAWVGLHPERLIGWFGLLATTQWEVFAAWRITRIIGCALRWRDLEAWVFLRLSAWLISWLPLPVQWDQASKAWWRPIHSAQPAAAR